MLISGKRVWKQILSKIGSRPPGGNRMSRKSRRPRSNAESLEFRCLLTTVVWDGVPDGGGVSTNTNWSNPDNWAGDVAPTADDDLVFPAGATVTTSVNDLVGGSFGSILIEGDNYDLSGEGIILNGSITVGGTGNAIGMNLTLGLSAGFATTGSGTFEIYGMVNLNGNDLSVSNSSGGRVELNNSIAGSGGLTFSGSGTFVLAATNSYTGETLVSGGTLVVQDALSLGTTDGTASTGTRVINGASLRLENSITVVNELLTSDDARVLSDGNNVWTGAMTDVGSDYLYLWPVDSTSSLQVDGDVTPYYLDVRTGDVILNGTSNSTTYTFVDDGATLELNGAHTAYYTYVYGGSTLEANSTYHNLYDTRVNTGGTLVVNDTYTNSNRYTFVYSGSTLVVNGTYAQGNYNPSYIIGTLNVTSGGTYSSTGYTYIQSSGTVTGGGVVSAGTTSSGYQLRIQSGGTIEPGMTSEPGILATGDLLFENANSNFDVQLDGTVAGTGYDQLQVTGSVQLDGKLNISVGYTPAVGDSFTIVQNDGIDPVIGSFSGLAEGSLFQIGSDYFRISYQGGSDDNDVVLTVVEVGIWDGAPDGGGTSADADWSNGDNWVGDVAPLSHANLIFPTDALQTTNTNDFVGATFGSILIEGDNYDLRGESLTLSGSLTNQGANASLGFDLSLGTTTGIANFSATTLTLAGAVDLNGNDLLVSNSAGGKVELNSSIAGAGNLIFSGNGEFVLAAANSYTGETLVSGGTLVVQDALSLGTADGTASTGTRVINGSSLRLENSITVVDELLRSDDARVLSDGDNVWTGAMTDIGAGYLYLRPVDSSSSLRIDGDVTVFYLDVRTGDVSLNGTTNSTTYTYVLNSGSLEINAAHSAYYTYVDSGGTLEANNTYSNYYYTRVYNGATLVVNDSYTNQSRNTDIYSGGTLQVNGTYTHSSPVSYPAYIYGTMEVASGATYSSTFHTYVQSNGTVKGEGTVNAGTASSGYQLRVRSGGTIDPGTTTGPGILVMRDLLFESADSNFDVQLNGNIPGTGYDQLVVDGAVSIAGNLNVTLLTSFADVGDEFMILNNVSNQATTGTFNGLPENGLVKYAGNFWTISYRGGDGNDVVLRTQTINNFPTGTPQNVTTDEETPVSITLSGNDTDGVVASYAIETPPLHGTLSGTAPNLIYTPFKDYAGPDSFQFRVIDNSDGFGIATITIDVKPVQDPPTQVALSGSAIDENSASGSAVGILSTVDPDVDDTFVYTLASGVGDTDNGLFEIEDDRLQLGFVPDFETDSSFSVRIRSTDAAGDWVERVFTISVNDINESPTALSLSNSVVDENVAVGTVVGTFTTSDPDVGDSHTYALVSGAGGSDNDAFYIDDNQLKLKRVPDFESQSIYNVRVRTTDSGNRFADRTFAITVNDLNDAPTAAIAAGASRLEGTAVTFDGSGSTDPDGDALIYSWNFGDGSTGTGIAPSHTYAENGTYNVTLTVDDGNGESDTDSLTITVNNVAPTVELGPDVTLELGETLSVSGLFTDPGDDSWNATVNYSDGAGDETLALHADKSFALSHTYADIGTYTVTVTVQDDDGGSSTDTLKVVVLRAAAPDLTVSASTISFSPVNPAPGESVTINASVTNQGLLAASGIKVDFYDLDSLIGQTTITGSLAPGQSATVSLVTSFPEAGFRLITVKADPTDVSQPNGAIIELNEANNEASQLLQVGSPDASSATIVIQAASKSVEQNGFVSITGDSSYEFETVFGTQTFPVQGGRVSVRIVEPVSGSTVGVFDGAETNVSGSFRQTVRAPSVVGTYTLIVKVTDGTVVGEIQTTLDVLEREDDPDPDPGSGSGGPALGILITPGFVMENAGSGAALGTVTRADENDLSGDLIVTLVTNDTTEATVPGQVVIRDGEYSADFLINAVDDEVREGTQTVTITASAGGLTGKGTLLVGDNEPGPEPPPERPDVFITSDDIGFSDSNPDIGEPTIIFADVHYAGSAIANVPVTFSAIYPEGGVLKTDPIGTVYTDFSDGSGTKTVAIEWINGAGGGHVIQVFVKPVFVDPDVRQSTESNDKATKSITVGPVADETVAIEYLDPPTLLVDADGNGTVSPGDTLQYRIDFANNGTTDMTGAVVFEDYDETLVGTPFNISNGGAVFNGSISWNLGPVAAETSGSVTYNVIVKPASEFPSGTNLIASTAFFETDQTVPVSDSMQVGVQLEDTPPTTTATLSTEPNAAGWNNTDVDLTLNAVDEAGGSGVSLIVYSINGGAPIVVESDSVSIPFTQDGIYTVTYRAVDAAFNSEAEKTIQLKIDKTAPTAAHDGPYEVSEGASVLLDGTSSADALSGVKSVQWAIDADGLFDDGDKASFAGLDGDSTHTLSLRVIDQADNVSIVTTQVVVNNVAPTLEGVSSAAIDENGTATISGSFSDVGLLDTHEVTITWGDGTISAATVDQAARTFSASHHYLDDFPKGTSSDDIVVGITIEDDNAGSDSATTTVTVDNVAPEFDAGPDDVLLPPVAGAFNRTVGFTDPGTQDLHEITVDFGDGSVERTFSIPVGSRTFPLSHVYTADGEYTVTVTVNDDDLGSHTDSFLVEVFLNTPPTAHAGGPYAVPEGTAVTLNASLSSDEQNNITGYAWDLDNDGEFDDAFGVTPTISRAALAALGLGDDGVYPIAVEVTDAFDTTDVATTIVTVNNVAPVIQSYNAPVINEDGTATITGSFTDVGILDTHEVTIAWGDGTSSVATVDQQERRFTASHQYLDDNPTGTSSDVYNVTLTVEDDDNGSDSATTTVTVNNVDPILVSVDTDASSLLERSVDKAVGLTVTFSDVGTLDTHTVTVDWGDGTPVRLITLEKFTYQFSASHDYATGGIFEITVTLTDDDGGMIVDTTSAVVQGVGVIDGTLYIIGTEGRDHVTLKVNETNDELEVDVKLNQGGSGQGTGNGLGSGDDRVKLTLTASEIDRVVAFLFGGDDHYNGGEDDDSTLEGGSQNPDINIRQMVFGGDGRDQIKGGRWNDALFGGADRDLIDGRGGDDILAGGTGEDQIKGGRGKDLLIGGAVDNDFSEVSIIDDVDSAMAEWAAGDLADLLTLIGPILDDEEEDNLFGDEGEDKLIGGPGDTVEQ